MKKYNCNDCPAHKLINPAVYVGGAARCGPCALKFNTINNERREKEKEVFNNNNEDETDD